MRSAIDSSTNRRSFLKRAGGMGGALVSTGLLPGILNSKEAPAVGKSLKLKPAMDYGVASGDILEDRAVIWSRADRPSRLFVEWATTEKMENPRRVAGPAALEQSDFTAKLDLSDLPVGQDIFYRVRFQSLEDMTVFSDPVSGHFRTSPTVARKINLLWSGDTAGQGWGINPDWGGMRIYSAMADLEPDLFIHCGDTIYADGPLQGEVDLPDGTVWKNIVTESKSKVAETLAEFRGNFAYNMLDENVRRMSSQVPFIMQWDDHETVNNWYPAEMLTGDDRYKVKSAALLAARANRAFFEYNPIRSNINEPGRIYRRIPYGPLLDIFVIDMRTYRSDNGPNNQKVSGPETAFLGREQIRWLKQGLLGSKATWKIIASDMPIGLVVADGEKAFENLANGDGPPAGRELEMMDLLRFIHHNDIANVVWLTADVHYTAAHHYDPARAQFTEFRPFYEFVSGPLNAGTFGPNKLDNTFGPKVLFQKAPEKGQANLPPSAGMQFFGQIEIDGRSKTLTATLRDLEGDGLYSIEIEPE